MGAIWLTSDWHFYHTNILKQGRIGLRDFPTVDAMHETIITNLNDMVAANDKLYVLGDVTIKRPGKHGERGKWYEPVADLVSQIRCRNKRLILGNHDLWRASDYEAMGFQKVMGCRELHGCILTHIPVDYTELERFRANVHGHTHNRLVTGAPWNGYVNVCVDYPPCAYRPVRLDPESGFVYTEAL